MKRRLNSLIGSVIGGTDGEIGKVKEFYFDDRSWTIRYIIVETGGWLFGRQVLLSPLAVMETNWDEKLIKTNLTMDQIKNSPEIDTEKPVSRQHEMDLYRHYTWGDYYWAGGMGMGLSYPMMMNAPIQKENDVTDKEDSEDNPHLRSTQKVKGYDIKATDGEIGAVEDFIVDESSWSIDFMLVDTGNWFPGKKVLIATTMIKEINWESSTVIVQATENMIKNSPEYQPDEELSNSYESNLQNYYGQFI